MCITFSTIEGNFGLKSGLIHLVPKFGGLAGDEQNKRLLELVHTGMKPRSVTDAKIFLRAFLFSLTNKAKDLFYYLPPRSIITWTKQAHLVERQSKHQIYDK